MISSVVCGIIFLFERIKQIFLNLILNIQSKPAKTYTFVWSFFPLQMFNICNEIVNKIDWVPFNFQFATKVITILFHQNKSETNIGLPEYWSQIYIIYCYKRSVSHKRNIFNSCTINHSLPDLCEGMHGVWNLRMLIFYDIVWY